MKEKSKCMSHSTIESMETKILLLHWWEDPIGWNGSDFNGITVLITISSTYFLILKILILTFLENNNFTH